MPKNNFKAFIISLIVVFAGTVYFFANRAFEDGKNESPIVSKYLQSQEVQKESYAKVSIILTGDVMLGRTVEQTAKEQKDVNYPFLKVADTLQRADIAFVNLENPVIQNCPPHDSGFKFCANPGMVDGMVYAGIDIVTLANNHTENYGQKGVAETQAILTQKGIAQTGEGQLSIFDKTGTRFGFLGFNKAQDANPHLTPEERKLIEESNKKVDVLIVAMHWGIEYQNTALPGVRLLAKDLVSSGADVVVGAHPHWVQDSEYIKGPDGVGRPVYYSLGNFVFDQMWSEETKKGLAMRLTFEKDKLSKEEFLPVYIANRGQPEFVNK